MGHTIFVVLHLVAFLFGMGFLFLTIPAHVIYAVLAPGRTTDDANSPRPETHVRCPDCRELVLKDARICRHCRCRLVPQD